MKQETATHKSRLSLLLSVAMAVALCVTLAFSMTPAIAQTGGTASGQAITAMAGKTVKKSLKAKVGKTVNLATKYKIKKATNWKSSKPKIVSVTKKGKISALKAGKAVISCKAGNKTYKVTVTVKGALTVKAGKTVNMKAKFKTLKNAKKFTSSKPAVAKVTKKGKLTALKAGKTVISCKIAGKTYKIKVTVSAAPSPEPPAPGPEPPAPEPVAPGAVTKTIGDYEPLNIFYDNTEEIEAAKGSLQTAPEPADVAIAVADQNGATGVVLVASSEEANTTDLYLNALVAGNELTINANGGEIASAASSLQGDLALNEGKVVFTPSTMKAGAPVDEVVTVTMASGTVYAVHTLPQDFPEFSVTGVGVAAGEEGVYSFSVGGYQMRVDSDGNVVYYRKGGKNNMQPHETADGMFYSYAIDLASSGAFGQSLSAFLVMDANYVDVDTVVLAANDDPNHTHGEFALDAHEFRVLGQGNYIVEAYVPHQVELSGSLANHGIDGTSNAYVKASVIQQVKNGKVVWEMDSTDYPIFLESAVEGNFYQNSSESNAVDYMHVNGVDWIGDGNGNVSKILVSFRMQSSLVQFDVSDPANVRIDWIFGGKASTLTGFEAISSTRVDDNWGNEFTAPMFGQHYGRYSNAVDHVIPAGQSPVVSVFDNQTIELASSGQGFGQCPTRTYRFTVDESADTVVVSDMVEGTYLDSKSRFAHYGDHCGSVDYFSDTSVVIGWGAQFGKGGVKVPTAMVTDYNPAIDDISFEIAANGGSSWSYRTYKSLFDYKALPAPVVKQGTVTHSIEDVTFNNYEPFDFASDIASEIAAKTLVPAAADVAIAVADENGATGVELVAASDAANTADLYLNALVAGNELAISATSGSISSASSSAQGALAVADGRVAFTPLTMAADGPADEVVTVTMADGSVYRIHTVPEQFPVIDIAGTGVSDADQGVYTWSQYGWLLNVDTNGNIVYYRDLNCSIPGAANRLGNMNFQPHDTADGMFYSYAIAIGSFGRGGASEDFIVVMDKDYVEVDTVTLMANDTANHTHGVGYLDFHEFLVKGANDYIVMGYNRLQVTLPDSLKGVNGTQTAYVKATFFQEQKDGEVVWEINSADYPILFENSAEGCNYAGSSARNYADYMHCNTVDWLEDASGNVTKILTSFRNHESLVQFDVTDPDAATIDWIYAGKASTLELDHAYTEIRTDLFGNEFESAEFGQHCCRYVVEDGVKNPNRISVFDNDTGSKSPYTTEGEGAEPTLSRTYIFAIDGGRTTIEPESVLEGTYYMELNKAANGEYTSYYFADHCASVFYLSPTSVFTGWGFDMVCDNRKAESPNYDANYPELALYCGVHPVLTDYDPVSKEITCEIKCTMADGSTGYAYRAYKTMCELPSHL